MDAIRKKMQSLKAETDTLYATIAKFEEDTREAVKRAEQVTKTKTSFGQEEESSSILKCLKRITLYVALKLERSFGKCSAPCLAAHC